MGVASFAGIYGAEQATADEGTIEFEARTQDGHEVWYGISPDSIAEETNPDLSLVEGDDYTVVWTNETDTAHTVVMF